MNQSLIIVVIMLLVVCGSCLFLISKYSTKYDNRLYLLLDKNGDYIDSLPNLERVLAKIKSKRLTSFSIKLFEYSTEEYTMNLEFKGEWVFNIKDPEYFELEDLLWESGK